MSDPGNTRKPGSEPMERVREGAGALRDEAQQQARGLRDEASAALEEVKAQGASVVESAQARLGEFADEKKEAGVKQAEGLARAIHRAADEIEDSAPWMARYVHEAAESVDGMARSLRDRRPRELVGTLEDLARRQPMAFFGAAALAGFAIARFARSTPTRGRGMRRSGGGAMGRGMGESLHRDSGSGSAVPGWQRHEGGMRPSTMSGATLGGAAARPQGGPGTPFGSSTG